MGGRTGGTVDMRPSFISGSRTDLSRVGGRSLAHHRYSSTSESDRLSSQAAADEAAQAYIRMLQTLLTMEEMKAFAILMKRWREGQMPFLEFCQKVLELYGEERKHLLARMRPFVSDTDAGEYEGFLEQSGVSENAGESRSPAEDSLAATAAELNSIRLFPTPHTSFALHPAPPIREEEEESRRSQSDGIVRMEIGPGPSSPRPASHRSTTPH